MVSEDSPHRLLVEGADDKWVTVRLLESLGHCTGPDDNWAPFIEECGGYDSLVRAIYPASRTYRRLGVIVDADSSFDNRWESVRHAFQRSDIVLEPVHREGLVASGYLPDSRIGLWIMPDNLSAGALEDFLSRLIQRDDAIWPYARRATREARDHGATFRDVHRSKAEIHAWLAWKDEPGMQFGSAIIARFFDLENDLARQFCDWFLRVFRDK